MTVEVVDIAKILGGAEVLEQEINILADLKRAIERGLPAEAAKQTMDAIGGPDVETMFMSLVFQSPERMKELDRTPIWHGTLTPAESERTERIARIAALAAKALGDEESARVFLTTPHSRLGGAVPLRYLTNEVGALEVEEILNSVFYGLPA